MSEAFWKGPHLTNTRCTVDLVSSCRNDWDYSLCSTLSRHDPCWAARHVELLDCYKSWISLLVCRQIPPRELNVPKCCAKTGIHTFLCTLTTFPSGQKQHNWVERSSSTACHSLSPANNQSGVPHEWAVFWQKKVGFCSTPPSQLCSKDLGGGCEIQCRTWDGDGFIPV